MSQELTGQAFVRYALQIGALEILPRGRKLKSGRTSHYFFNSGLFTTGEALVNLSESYAARAKNLQFDVIFGPAYKGIPLAVGVAGAFWRRFHRNVEWAFNRKEEKNHGEGGIVVGASLQGKCVLIVDDVMTTGVSAEEAVHIIQQAGGTPVGCIIAFDRQERREESDLSAVQEFQQEYQIPVFASATFADLIAVLIGELEWTTPVDTFQERLVLEKLYAYRDQYGVS